ncbi:sporulation protein YunB [Salsuginibacillus halophilus]|uniref:Sporulation protein YunB n=1 Tax=Salsuginibacillus halophilus TaxID=517424 RepID=A0A2P8HE42_9BACI|nr:sporulation protein YunB [Salsuginibacillus halophilus]PSL44441.1 sporulation protein YunB [Salsuginibacillus halophilus]
MKGLKTPKKPRGPLPLRYVMIWSVLIFTVLTLHGLWLVDQGIRPTLVAIAETETQKIATQAINDAISKKVVESTDMEDLVEVDTNDDGVITSIEFNSRIYNRVLSESVLRVQKYLKLMEEGRVDELELPDGIRLEIEDADYTEEGIIHMIPLGQATNNALLAHLGPKIPVRFSVIGDVEAEMLEEIEETGINNTYIRVSVLLKVDVEVIIPFATETSVVETAVPAGMVFVPGEVPDFYNHGDGSGMPAPAIIQEEDLNDALEE